MVYSLVSIYIDLAYNKNKLCDTLDYWSRDMLNFYFLDNDLGIISSTYFVYDFSRRMLYSVKWQNFIAWLPLLLEVLGNMSIAIICFPGCDVINFEINIIFLIKPVFYLTRKSRQKFKYLENKKSFYVEIKSIFHHFKRAFCSQNLSQTLECAFKTKMGKRDFSQKKWSIINFSHSESLNFIQKNQTNQ